jgi:hypothetical protein
MSEGANAIALSKIFDCLLSTMEEFLANKVA